MIQLVQTIPDYQILVSLEPEELAGKLIFLLRKHQGVTFHPNRLKNELWGYPDQGVQVKGYPYEHKEEIEVAYTEAWGWAEAHGLIIAAAGANGLSGWRRLSRRAQRMELVTDFMDYRIAR